MIPEIMQKGGEGGIDRGIAAIEIATRVALKNIIEQKCTAIRCAGQAPATIYKLLCLFWHDLQLQLLGMPQNRQRAAYGHADVG